ncbi:MAG TPA: ECF-type sigma factor [Gemmataceae bacterium]|jgi:RNA polymerase sigma factor (TIGR02999 family)|nr:ECF-type sigma factor [Gemmataceae bacterium]
MSDVTRLIEAAQAGDRKAAADLLPLVYTELRKLAAARLAGESPSHTLQPTALVHEAYLRLVGPADAARWDGRGHFFAAAAEAMRRILVEAARRRSAQKRGGERGREAIELEGLAAPGQAAELLAVSEALDGLAAVDPQAAEVVKLRYFAGLTVDEAAAALGTSTRTAERLWVYARTWLRRAIEGPGPDAGNN